MKKKIFLKKLKTNCENVQCFNNYIEFLYIFRFMALETKSNFDKKKICLQLGRPGRILAEKNFCSIKIEHFL